MNALIKELTQLGITEVRLSYSGSGDEGYIDDYWFTPNLDTPHPVMQRLEDWAYDVLEQHFGGWEINEGSSGTITMDVVNQKATISHDENVIVTNNETVNLVIT